MGCEDDSTRNPPPDNLRLIEAAEISARADLAVNAVEVRVRDQGGTGVRFLIGPAEAARLVMDLLAALGELVPPGPIGSRF